MPDRGETLRLRDLDRRLGSVRGGAGAGLRSTPMGLWGKNLMNSVQFAKVRSKVEAAIYRLTAINVDGAAVGGTTDVPSE